MSRLKELLDMTPHFLNLSNHPLITWSDDQRESAEALGFGEVVDLEEGMPLVDPRASTEEVEDLAQSIADRALRQGVRAAFVAGEFTLTQALVAILQSRGIPCYSATTERQAILEEKEDGSMERRSIFRFVAWRAYSDRSSRLQTASQGGDHQKRETSEKG